MYLGGWLVCSLPVCQSVKSVLFVVYLDCLFACFDLVCFSSLSSLFLGLLRVLALLVLSFPVFLFLWLLLLLLSLSLSFSSSSLSLLSSSFFFFFRKSSGQVKGTHQMHSFFSKATFYISWMQRNSFHLRFSH